MDTTKIDATRLKALHALNGSKWVPPLLARLVLGVVFASSGWGKLWQLEQFGAFLGSLGIPAPDFFAPLVAGSEFFGGALLLFGLATRIASVPLIINMVVALITALASEITGLRSLFGLSETLYIGLLAYLVVLGPGAMSLDYGIAYWLASYDREREPRQSAPKSVDWWPKQHRPA